MVCPFLCELHPSTKPRELLLFHFSQCPPRPPAFPRSRSWPKLPLFLPWNTVTVSSPLGPLWSPRQNHHLRPFQNFPTSLAESLKRPCYARFYFFSALCTASSPSFKKFLISHNPLYLDAGAESFVINLSISRLLATEKEPGTYPLTVGVKNKRSYSCELALHPRHQGDVREAERESSGQHLTNQPTLSGLQGPSRTCLSGLSSSSTLFSHLYAITVWSVLT